MKKNRVTNLHQPKTPHWYWSFKPSSLYSFKYRIGPTSHFWKSARGTRSLINIWLLKRENDLVHQLLHYYYCTWKYQIVSVFSNGPHHKVSNKVKPTLVSYIVPKDFKYLKQYTKLSKSKQISRYPPKDHIPQPHRHLATKGCEVDSIIL